MRTLGLLPMLALACVLALVLATGGPARAAGALPAPAERARALEEVGKFAEAARLYEAALKDGKAPALLYRLALCKRHLGDYAGAREALRGYLREEPGGPLRIEVERQLAQLQVLIEERGLHPERAARGGGRKGAQGAAAESGSVPATGSVPVTDSAPAPGTVPVTGSVTETGSVPAAAAPSGSGVEFAPVSAPTSAAGPSSATTSSSVGVAVAQPSALTSAPASALAGPPAPSSLKSALPFAAGAAAAGVAGALLLWDGARVSSDLDARFAAGNLTAADQPRYTRAHREGAAGMALLSVAVLAAGAAVYVVAF